MPTRNRLITSRFEGLWNFDGVIRRRGRLLGRLAAASITPSLYPRVGVARAFWFDGIANFGDALTPWLLRHAGVVPIHSRPGSAELVGAGSILEMLPADFAGAIWGSGLLRDVHLTLPRAHLLAVRGQLTAARLGAPNTTVLGDPGLLVSRFLRRPRRRWRLGIVPHHMHENDRLWESIRAHAPTETHIINVRRGPTAVVNEIAACDHILSTSLHGLITADSFGIPAVWARREPDLWGGRFKFLDYESAATPGVTRETVLEDGVVTQSDVISRTTAANATQVRSLQDGLLESLHTLELPRVVPFLAVQRVFGA